MTMRPSRSNDEIRMLILRYLYDRHNSATSERGKHGAAVKISTLKQEMKERHGLTREEVWSNLLYLISQGWVDKQSQDRVVPTNTGRQIPSTTLFYAITALGIDKIEGPGTFTRSRFEGIQISDSNHVIITTGDGNQVNVKYEEPAEALATLHRAITQSTEMDVDSKVDAVANIETIQAQLARSSPNRTVIQTVWQSIRPLERLTSLASHIIKVGQQLAMFL